MIDPIMAAASVRAELPKRTAVNNKEPNKSGHGFKAVMDAANAKYRRECNANGKA